MLAHRDGSIHLRLESPTRLLVLSACMKKEVDIEFKYIFAGKVSWCTNVTPIRSAVVLVAALDLSDIVASHRFP